MPLLIPETGGLLPGNVLTTIYYSQGTSVISKIKNINFSSEDTAPSFTLKLYISFDAGVTDILLWSKTLNGGDHTIDTNVYFLSSDMRLKALVDINNLVSYLIVAELINS